MTISQLSRWLGNLKYMLKEMATFLFLVHLLCLFLSMIPLYIFLDLEAAHGDIFFGDIIEIAAQVDTRLLRNEVFHRLINTKQSLAYFGKLLQ